MRSRPPLPRPTGFSGCLHSVLAWAILWSVTLVSPALGQKVALRPVATPRPLITQSVDESQLTTLKGNTHPLARAEFELGAAATNLPMKRMLLVLKRGPDQEAALEKVLDDQQNMGSPNHHRWLTPEQFGQQFGPSDSDLEVITGWLQSHGFEVGSTKGRTVLEFSGSAGQVQEAFHTSIHRYLVNGEQHWGNASDPQIPTALTPVVAGVASLNNFPRKAMNRPYGHFVRDKTTGKLTGKPLFSFPGGCDQDHNCYAIGPYDFATIYDLLPLWNAGTSGQNQTIAIVGETNINLQDVTDFRTMFGLPANGFPANNVNVILNGPDPGIGGDESEADIDVQWSGAVAPNATIDFVVSQSTESTDGIDLSAVYIVENNLAPVMSESYGFCELGLGASGNQFFSTLWQQAAAQGITVFIASGDDGAAGCDFNQGTIPQPAQYGLAVSGYASTPYNVAVGGTDFNDVSSPTTYWNTTNDPTTQASAKGYIPETTWNDSCTNGILASLGGTTNALTNCNDSRFSSLVWTVGGSGGASNCTNPNGNTVASCTGGYAKPAWQTGNGVPKDGKRDVPDVSLFASNGFMGNFYVICQSDATQQTCNSSNDSSFEGFGGTSVSSPAFAGVMALVNQQTGERQGNANYVLYKLAAQQPTAFHDVTSGTIAMPCAVGSPNCTTTSPGDAFGVLSGYATTAGYDLATGLGSVDIDRLVTLWTSVALAPSVTTVTNLSPTTITHGQAVNFTVVVKPQSGTGTPMGEISLVGGAKNQPFAGFNLASGSVSSSTELLPGGAYSLTAHYPGDSTYAPSDSASVPVTVKQENSQAQVFLVTLDSSGHVVSSNTNTATYGSPYILRVNVKNSAAQLCSPVNPLGSTGCPTGSVTLTDNGSALDAGTYVLNSYGYFEDQTVQLPGGANSVTAAYAGDNSFNSGAATSSLSITPAGTTITAPAVISSQVGNPVYLSTTVNTQSNGAAPSGSVSFQVNGAPLAATAQYTPAAGSPTSTAYLGASTTYLPTVSGSYTFSASYSGDGNYTSAPLAVGQTVVLKYPPPSVYLQSSSYTATPGSTITLTAEIITTSGNAVPTGTVSFNNSLGPITGVTYSMVVNSATGYTDMLATVTFTPTFTDYYEAQYSGDSNYPANTGSSSRVDVTGNDFTISFPQPSVTIIRGGYAQFNMFIGMQDGTSPVTFSATACSGMPAETTCGANLAPVPYTVMDLLNVSATAPHSDLKRSASHPASGWWIASAATLFGGVLLLGTVSPRRRRWSRLFALPALMLLMMLPACGGGSAGTGGGGGGGGPTDPGTPAGSYPVTVTATSGAISHSSTFKLIVQ